MLESTTLETVTVEFTQDELLLVKTALQLLRSTLGRQEAEELDEVRALLTRLEEAATEGWPG